LIEPHIITNLSAIEIEQRLPHAGKMSLLNKIIIVDKYTLTAQAKNHLEPHNPLSIKGKINSINGIEYAAQAMALHGSLLSAKVSVGYIASIRNIELKSPFFPKINEPLQIHVVKLMGNKTGFTYQFDVQCQQIELISGKITVFLL
jgi:predicted hotdog family 3-hydroxylacyl-ACP dehydratase